MLRFQESVGCNNHSEGAGRIKTRSLHPQKSSVRCEIAVRFQPGQGRSRSHRTSARRKVADRRHRRQERDRCLQSAGIAFTTAVGILIRSREKGLLEEPDAIAKLALLAKYGRYKHSIIEDARLKSEAKP